MKVSGAFLVNTKNFESIISALIEYGQEKPAINADLLEELGYSDPNDLLLVRLLKDLNIINNEGKAAKYYEEFRNPGTTRKALAKGLYEANEKLFDSYPEIHQASPEKIQEALKELFQGDKTDLIIRYIANTFHKVVTYAGVSTVDKVVKGEVVSVTEVASVNTNGVPVDEDFTPDDQIENSKDDNIINNSETDEDHIASAEEVDDENQTDNYEEKSEIDNMEDSIPFKKEEDSQGNDEKISTSSPEKNKAMHQIDNDPFELETPLAEATRKNESIKETGSEHKFVSTALLRKADLLHKLERWDDLLPTLEEIIKRYDDEQQPSNLREAASRSIIRRATTLLKLNREKEALSALDTVISRFKDSENENFYNQASRAMLYKAQVLEKEDEATGLLSLYNTIVARLDGSSEIIMKDKLDQIHLKRFDLICKESEEEQILNASTQLIKRFKNNNKHQDYVQKAMITRAELLDNMNRDEEALEAYDEFLEVFGN